MAFVPPRFNPSLAIPNNPFYSPETYYLCGPYYPALVVPSSGMTICPNGVICVTGGGGGGGVSSVTGSAPIVIGGTASNPVVTVSPASQTALGVIEIATATEVAAGTSSTLAVTPATLALNYMPKSGGTFTGPVTFSAPIIANSTALFNGAVTTTNTVTNCGAVTNCSTTTNVGAVTNCALVTNCANVVTCGTTTNVGAVTNCALVTNCANVVTCGTTTNVGTVTNCSNVFTCGSTTNGGPVLNCSSLTTCGVTTAIGPVINCNTVTNCGTTTNVGNVLNCANTVTCGTTTTVGAVTNCGPVTNCNTTTNVGAVTNCALVTNCNNVVTCGTTTNVGAVTNCSLVTNCNGTVTYGTAINNGNVINCGTTTLCGPTTFCDVATFTCPATFCQPVTFCSTPILPPGTPLGCALCITYNNATSGLTGANVQAAIDELALRGTTPATTTALGVVCIGTNISVTPAGQISVCAATTALPGVVQLVDALNSTSTTQALTAAQGKCLQDQISTLSTSGGTVFAGTLNASTGNLAVVTSLGTTAGYTSGSPLPVASSTTNNTYVQVTIPGTVTPPGGTPTVASQGDLFIVVENPVGTYTWQFLNVGYEAPAASTTTAGIVELSTNAETQAGTDANLAVTPASLQSKLSDATNTTSSTTIASSTAVKTAYDLAAAAIPKSALTLKGDLIVATGTCTYASLPVGANGRVLTANSACVAGVEWLTPTAAIPCACITAKGSLISGTAASTPVALAVGTAGQVLTVDATCATGLKWATPASALAVGTTPVSNATDGYILYNSAGVLSEKGTTGSNNVVLATTPTITGLIGTQAAPTISANAITIDATAGNIHNFSLTSSVNTVTLSNAPATGSSYTTTVYVSGTGTAATVTWPTSVVWLGGTPPAPSTGTGTISAYSLTTFDGGTTWYGSYLGSGSAPGSPSAPLSVSATAGNAQAIISFSPPATGSPITSYTATSSPGGISVSGASSPITVTGLTNGTAYTFTVTATNAIGTGPASTASNSVTPFSGTLPGAPTSVTATAGNAQATVSFTAPSPGSSPITSYTVTSSPGGITATGSASPINVTGLTNGTAYTFTVTATSAVGTGPASTASNSVTPSAISVPGAPTSPSAKVGGPTSATVTFTAPTSDGGSPITSYTVTSSPGGFTGTGSSSPITVTGLTTGTSYTFTVTATNAAGTGPASITSNTMRPNAVADGTAIVFNTTTTQLGLVAVNGTSTTFPYPTGVTLTGFTSIPPSVGIDFTSGYTYVPEPNTGDIWVVNSGTSTATKSSALRTALGLTNLTTYYLTVDQGTGNVWVTVNYNTTNAQYLVKFSQGLVSPVIYTLGSAGLSSYVSNPVIDTSGNVFVGTGQGVFRVTPGQAAGTIAIWNSAVASVTKLGIDPSNNLYAPSSFTNGPIRKIAADGTANLTWGANYPATPNGIICTPDGGIYVYNGSNATISKYSTTGVLTNNWVTLTAGGGLRPLGFDYDSSSNLYIVNTKITKITPAGVQDGTYGNLGANNVQVIGYNRG